MSPSALRGAAAALSPAQEELGAPPQTEEEEGAPGTGAGAPGSPPGPSEQTVDSHEQRSQALRALLLQRKRKNHTGEGMRTHAHAQ